MAQYSDWPTHYLPDQLFDRLHTVLERETRRVGRRKPAAREINGDRAKSITQRIGQAVKEITPAAESMKTEQLRPGAVLRKVQSATRSKFVNLAHVSPDPL
jgi:hypothetical protein